MDANAEVPAESFVERIPRDVVADAPFAEICNLLPETVILTTAVVVVVSLLVAVIVKLLASTADVGVPEIAPVAVFKLKPAGNPVVSA